MNNQAERLRKLADSLDAVIEDKRRPMTQNPTPKRNREYRSRCHDGDNWQRTQQALRVLADHHELGTVPAILADVRSKADVHGLVYKGLDGGGYYDVIPAKDYSNKTTQGRAMQALLEAKPQTAAERAANAAQEQRRAIEDLEEKLRFCNTPGFFPTPARLANDVARRLDVQPWHTVLEPSAGIGSLADSISAREPRAKITTIERLNTARQILKLKGYHVPDAEDFLQFRNGGFDRVAMNPPFEKGADAEHVRHAFDQLNPGGMLVAIMSEGTFNRSDRKATEFRAWLEQVGGISEPVEAGAFQGVQAFRQTGVATRIVEITKDGEAATPTPQQITTPSPDTTTAEPDLFTQTAEPTTTQQPKQEYQTMNTGKTITVELTHKSDHKGSVRFDSVKPAQGPPLALDNVYIGRIFAPINTAKKIRVTIEVLE
jgi:predicted RNA methylase